jgi:hypothetical protein
MQRITRVVLVSSTVLLVAGCAKSEPAKDTTAAMAADTAAPIAAAPAALSLADVAGKWQMRATPESGKDTSATDYVLTATADTTGWTMAFPKSGVTAKLHVSVAGDSVMLKSDAFPSQRRKGAKVMTETTLRLGDGKLAGPTIAHYANVGADSVTRMRSEGTKSP